MVQEIIIFVICTVITAFLGIVTYFLKRTMDRLDKTERDLADVKEKFINLSDKFATKNEIREIKTSIDRNAKDFATKEEVREIKEGMKKMTYDIDFIKEHTMRKEDLVRLIVGLENKIESLRGR